MIFTQCIFLQIVEQCVYLYTVLDYIWTLKIGVYKN